MHSTARDVSLVANDQSRQQSTDGGGEKVYYDVHVVFDGQGRPAGQ